MSTYIEETRTRRGAGLVGPVMLISAGVIFLLNNLGMLDWSIWLTLLRLWPVLLIATGLDILIGRRSWLGSAIVALLLVGVLALAVSGAINPAANATGSAVDRTETVRAALQGAQRADIDIEFGTGQLMVAALPADSGDLLTGTLDLSRDERLDQSQSVTGEQAQVNLRSENNWVTGFTGLNADDKQWEIALNRDVPLTLSFNTGVGESNLDLTQLTLSRLDINGGVGEVTVKLPAQGQFDVSLDGGIGEVTVILPESLAARITVDGGLGNTDIPASFEKRDDVYTSPDFATGESRVEMSLDGGIGQIVVRQATE